MRALSGRGPVLVIAIALGGLAGSAATVLAAGLAGGDDVHARPVALRLGIERAAGIASRTVPGGHIEGLELGYNGRTLIWEADVIATDGTARELHIDSRDGRVVADRLDPPEEGEDGDDCDDGTTGRPDQAAALGAAKITAARAARAALEEVPGIVAAVDFEYRRTAHVWEVDVTARDGREHKLRVDTATGEVIADAPGEDDG
ncbi:PepSY domain-containing protein [Actinomadura madurae]|uniref:PepSY domain-containing protein n=1 Tax=Actinomadura madurae TaxID=1993 RepID=UPI0020270A9A|nr:PepSY domain-containing protein [Actinomadura madurae]MCQ0005761.1 PepSY domain-containing protein [Actinomadura madurae]MCQ0018927.1 PepSY domain-containing protein [Actinomadura madurae]URM98954.1 PepSY domain-containing protein [Actinomadura madurae]